MIYHSENIKIAFLLTGQIRIKDEIHLNTFRNFVKDGDLFINTYDAYNNICNELGNNIKYIGLYDHDLSRSPAKDYNILKSNWGQVKQWFLLSELIDLHISDLIDYDLIVRIRPDLSFSCDNFKQEISKHQILNFYCDTDWLFYSTPEKFLTTFYDYWGVMASNYINKNNIYHDINYINLLNSDLTSIRYRRFFYPSSIFKDKNSIYNMSDFKKTIQDNIDILYKKQFDKNNIHCIWPGWQGSSFSSEKFLALHVTSRYTSETTAFNASLLPRRHNFKYHIKF
jgi:hypothetical protein